MSAWSWGQSDAVRVVLIARGTDGQELHWLGDLRGGRDKGKTIRLPSGTETVTIARPQHASVPLSTVRRDRWFPARPSRASSLGGPTRCGGWARCWLSWQDVASCDGCGA